MFTRIALLFGMFSTVGVGGYVAAQTHLQHGHGPFANLPHEHPITLAIEAKNDLQLDASQVAGLERLKEAMLKELEPTHAKLREIHEHALKAMESNNQEALRQVESEAKALESSAAPILHRYAMETRKILSPQQAERLMAMLHAQMSKRGTENFLLMHLMQLREQLGISPKQFTQLQLLQAEFITAFAPLREQLEEIHLQIKESGKHPSQEMLNEATGLQKQIQELQNRYSHRAAQDVLTAEQRKKLAELHKKGEREPGLHGTGHGG